MKSNRSLFTALAALAMAVLATTAFASKYSNTIMSNTNLRAYWQFDEAAGSTQLNPTVAITGGTGAANSWSPYNAAGGIQGAKGPVPAGIDGLGVDLKTGVSRGLYGENFDTAANLAVFQGYNPSAFTIEFWMKPITDTTPTLIMSAGGNTGFYLDWNQGDGNHPYVGFSSGAELTKVIRQSEQVAANPLTVGQWAFVAFTFDSANNHAAFYINGVNQLDPAQYPLGYKTFSGLTRANWDLMWVQNNNGDELYFDELAVFDTVLTQQQILDQFNAIPEPGMLSLLALGGAFMVWRRHAAAKRA